MEFDDVVLGLGYVVVGALALARARTLPVTSRSTTARAYWWCSGIAFLLLGVARTGPGELFVDQLRALAYRDGWYDSRSDVQIAALLALAIAGGGAALVLGPRLDAAARLHLAAIAALVALAAARVISLHRVDALLLSKPVGPLTTAHWAEFALLLLAAAISRRGEPSGSPSIT